jgi:hypothetical protein
VAEVGAQVPGEERVLFGGIAADEQDGLRRFGVAQAGGAAGGSGEGLGEARVVGGADVVDAVGGEDRAGEFLQQVVFFVGGRCWSR